MPEAVPSPRLSRRQVLLSGAATAVALPAAGCTLFDDGSRPDPLIALASAARSDAADARRIAAAFPDLPGATEVADGRERQARALQHEIDRAAGGETGSATSTTPSRNTTPAPDRAAAARSLSRSLHAAQQQAAKLVPTLPRYRAGLVASVSAGCAALHGVLR